MLVHELIKRLQAMPQNDDVILVSGSTGDDYDIAGVVLVKDSRYPVGTPMHQHIVIGFSPIYTC